MSRILLLTLGVALLAGCQGRPHREVRAEAIPIALVPLPAVNQPGYSLGCPDLLEVHFDDRPNWDALATVDTDGALNLGEAGRPRVEGLPIEEARAIIAREARMPLDRVRISLVDPSAKFLTLRGPEANRQQWLVYRGPERVLDFLQRTAALKPGCTDIRDVTVVRPNVARGTATEYFLVDFEAILLDNDESTNVVLQPGDQVTVGETRRSSFIRLLPIWLKPFYRKLLRVRV